eukprot:CAMPEP_0172471030 /NCGR_PEP_ID=MMETSP1065-20121228/67607_1 /TAXON_ID=265537 /ORGANISM="Amphiprora paludosa, Strain CCMP125" /LENGTH=247 /DNA_ID=CAMNT_0013229113 /DNA_START=311 /DNA_END=1053 /DNA_ORIENTATION=-
MNHYWTALSMLLLPHLASATITFTDNCTVLFEVEKVHAGCPYNGTEVLDRMSLFVDTAKEWQCSLEENSRRRLETTALSSSSALRRTAQQPQEQDQRELNCVGPHLLETTTTASSALRRTAQQQEQDQRELNCVGPICYQFCTPGEQYYDPYYCAALCFSPGCYRKLEGQEEPEVNDYDSMLLEQQRSLSSAAVLNCTSLDYALDCTPCTISMGGMIKGMEKDQPSDIKSCLNGINCWVCPLECTIE